MKILEKRRRNNLHKEIYVRAKDFIGPTVNGQTVTFDQRFSAHYQSRVAEMHRKSTREKEKEPVI